MEEFKQPQSTEYALTSIAISLKRIADKLELAQKQPIMMTADEAEKYQAILKFTG